LKPAQWLEDKFSGSGRGKGAGFAEENWEKPFQASEDRKAKEALKDAKELAAGVEDQCCLGTSWK